MARTYGERDLARGRDATVAWLAEELGELARAARKGTPEEQLHELGDVLAWLASLAEQLGLYYQRRWRLDFRAARMAAIVGPSRIAGSGSATMYTSLVLEKAALGEPYEIDVDPEAGTPVLR